MIRRSVVSKLLWSAGAFESQGTLGFGPGVVMKSWPVTPASVASGLPSVKWVGIGNVRPVVQDLCPAHGNLPGQWVEILLIWGPG